MAKAAATKKKGKSKAGKAGKAAIDAQKKVQESVAKAAASLKLRGIGPAVMGGRIADIAVHPTKPRSWYVAVGSGGVWKTVNGGITWKPVFENEKSYSVGCITIDPTNPNIVWVGTGENVSGRHVGWGSGVYRSKNGGQSWQCMGLEKSEHISRIIVDPRDSQTIFVAAEGPLWADGGERGVYKTTDGGKSWTAVLTVDNQTGATDVLFAPHNPEILYAATYQRRRHTWGFLAGGPGSAIYKSVDGGINWQKLVEGLPKKGMMGKIGLAVTAANADLLYATIEGSEEKEKGFYRSLDQGESWERRNEYLSGGTGPHYYQEIEASPTDPDTVYQMDVFVHFSKDGGKSFNRLEDGNGKHCDNHALWVDPTDGDHLLVGSDGGLYETFDHGGSWRHFPNLPISQFYRVAVDNAEPFFNILGGAQDLGTLYGPSRTTHTDGVRNQDWSVPLGADGYHTAIDPEDPNIMYLEWQVGNVVRYDLRSKELLDIKPQPAPGEPAERWNWDAPIMISPHSSSRIYVASYRVWRSDDRGQSWTAVSGDLTRNENRYELAMGGKVWPVDGLYDNGAMSQYNTITHLTESPLVEGLLYVGTDDGLIQVSEDGGNHWRLAGKLPVPERALVNNLKGSQHRPDTAFAAINAHQSGDFKPYLFVTHDRGRKWESIAGDLPDGTAVWAIEQDHEQEALLFAGTEFGLYYTVNGGENWHKLSGPTIPYRDVVLHRRDNDLVGATFGRGFYLLDDISPLRHLTAATIAAAAALFPVRDAWWYVPNEPMQSKGQPTLGTTAFCADNPPFGALFTYHIAEDYLSAAKTRQAADKKLMEKGKDVPFAGWDTLLDEAVAAEPQLYLIVRESGGRVVRRLKAETKAGLHRSSWDLRMPAADPINLLPPEFKPPWYSDPQGALVAPGKYQVELVLVSSAGVQSLSKPEFFDVKPVASAPEGTDFEAAAAFQQKTLALFRDTLGAGKELDRADERLRHLAAAIVEAPAADEALFAEVNRLQKRLQAFRIELNGNPVLQKHNEPYPPAIQNRVGRVAWMHRSTRQLPTAVQEREVDYAAKAYTSFKKKLTTLLSKDLPKLEADLAAAGAPWTPGRKL